MRISQYPTRPGEHKAELEQHVQQLLVIAKALASEVQTLQRDFGVENKPVELGDGIDFYHEIERYEIDLIRSALHHCGGNQTHAARLLRMKSTTLNAKIKHYRIPSYVDRKL